MEFILSRVKSLPAATFFLAAPPAVVLLLYTVSNTSVPNQLYTHTIPHTFRTSKSLHTVNPRSYGMLMDTVEAPVPASCSSCSDREVLARFVQGYWGGWTFASERRLLTGLGKRICAFTDAPLRTDENITTDSEIAKLRRGDVLFGAFQILDVGECHVDFGFGNSEGGFAGCHRFEVYGFPSERRMRVAHVSCNPTKDGGLLGGWAGSWVMGLHGIYARLLFADGMRVVRSKA
ncbi:hypothetical protein EDC01DRAFT_654296 [Geopyxis carbonaria]|nr:hypothetical protein EDC01DRAFT_654296 [Geopyxis carbonaria]